MFVVLFSFVRVRHRAYLDEQARVKDSTTAGHRELAEHCPSWQGSSQRLG